MNYTAHNRSDKPISGMATFNVTPQVAGAYFNKIECFCFTDTYIEPGETLEMPVAFFVDPEMDQEKAFKGIKTITLSYTFYESSEQPTTVSKLEDVKAGDGAEDTSSKGNKPISVN